MRRRRGSTASETSRRWGRRRARGGRRRFRLAWPVPPVLPAGSASARDELRQAFRQPLDPAGALRGPFVTAARPRCLDLDRRRGNAGKERGDDRGAILGGPFERSRLLDRAPVLDGDTEGELIAIVDVERRGGAGQAE